MSNRAIAHFEIPSKDRETTTQFYSALFGWQFQHMGEPYNYTMFRVDNTGGGLAPLDDMTKPGDVLIYFSSEDIEADLKKAESLGGQVVMPTLEIPEYGWMAIFADPTGNRIGLWKDAPGLG